MLDLKAIRREPETVRAALARRRDGSDARLDRVLELDKEWRALTTTLENLRSMRNDASSNIAAGKKAGADVSEAIARTKQLSDDIKTLTEQHRGAETELNALLASLPNPPDPRAPDSDTTLREVGEAGASGRDHLELAGPMIDMEAGARVAGSRFAYLKGDLVLVEMALMRWALDVLGEEGFEPVVPPVLVREEALFGTGFLPDTEQQIYRLADDPLYLTGTSEVALASLHAGELLEAGALPLRYAGLSPCFRREAGAAGRDTRGIFRVHQFDKLEMFSFVEPEDAEAEHERLLALEERFLRDLETPYRVVDIAVDELGSSANRKFDLEAWIPSQQRYREVTSTSNTTDFQARRLDVRYRPEGGGTRHVATLNGTAVTWRHLIAILENGQREDGTVAVPAVLHAWGAPAVLGVQRSA